MNNNPEASCERKDTASLMRRALDLMPDGVLIIGSNRDVLYMNEAFETLWRVPRSVVEQGDRAMLAHVLEQLDDPGAFMNLVDRLYGSTEPSEDQLNFKDGRLFNRRSVALLENGGGFSRIWIFSDITEAWSARVDALTGLMNRRAYAQELPEFMASVTDESTKAFALLDVDNFKEYNDRYGHAKGDSVLERIGDLLRATLKRSSDRAYRIGGEEFAVATCHRDCTSAASFYEGLLTSIRSAKIEHAGNPPYGCITVSMGLGLFEGAREPAQIFSEVDRALYRAKRQGRNRTERVLLPAAH
ncbi:GGDEF domain-containing protein [Pelagibacterium montanilacus]|uniref:GGDEF domain-containing protein n=1 Tax=Pelagibacterium montanilacus TaxID=2185280 RepID=UPI000F8C6DCC|nr:sensor domain-containing diguanylate cyclase [Pelagibacterium montanilacus]